MRREPQLDAKSTSTARASVRFREQLRDMWLKRSRRGCGRETIHDVAASIQQKLGKIPLDALGPEQALSLGLEPVVKGVSVLAVDVNPSKQRKCNIVFRGTESADFLGIAWFLFAELIAGKAQDDKARVAMLAVERFETRILWRKAATACDIDDEYHFAAVGIEGRCLPVEQNKGDLMGGRLGAVARHVARSIKPQRSECKCDNAIRYLLAAFWGLERSFSDRRCGPFP